MPSSACVLIRGIILEAKRLRDHFQVHSYPCCTSVNNISTEGLIALTQKKLYPVKFQPWMLYSVKQSQVFHDDLLHGVQFAPQLCSCDRVGGCNGIEHSDWYAVGAG